MTKIDLLNSYDVLSVARRWSGADTDALDQAQRLTSTEAVAAEVARVTALIPPLRRRERLLDGLSLLGLAVMLPGALGGVLLVLGMTDVVDHYLHFLAGPVARAVPLMGVFFWLMCVGLSNIPGSAREDLEKQLALLTPLEASPECETALEYLEAGTPEVLAWRDIALYDRKVLYRFDLAVLRALHKVALVERSASDKSAAAEAAYRQLYGNSVPAAEASH